MRSTVIILLFVLYVPIAIGQQTNPVCPTIEISGPSGVTNPGDTMTFTVTLSPAPKGVEYVWKVSRGVIEKGQGTQSIVVRSSFADESQNLDASVFVAGLPGNCKSNATETAPIAAIPIGEPVDQFGILPRNDIRGRLDNYFMELSNNPTNRGYVVIELGPSDKPNPTNSRYRLILQHAAFRKFDVSRIDVAFERGSQTGTTLWRVPPGARLPKCDCIPLKR